MATIQTSAEVSRPSFAKVAASTSKDTAASKTKPSHSPQTHQQPAFPIIANGAYRRVQAPASASPAQGTNILPISPDAGALDSTTQSFNELRLGTKLPNLVVNGSTSIERERPLAMISRESGSDDSQRADSNSELGTKPPSLDGKSITSGTTFALDEKESLRPDDSASVKAAAEDDDAFSIRGSLIAGSRMGSDLAVRARGIQLGDMPERKLAQPAVGVHVPGLLTPPSASSDQAAGLNAAIALGGAEASADALNVIYRQAPDEKLLEALASPKDRYFLLRLEKEVIDFVQDSKEPYMDLPPSNSFCRMLTHKLADYYHMTHSYEPQIGSVRIFRTPFCRVPPSLAAMSPPDESASSTPPPAVLPRKIMRRGQDDEGGLSGDASKTTSEIGSDGKALKDKQSLANQKLSREEREELYKLARERIFGSSEESILDNESANDLSRASSVSANKSNAGKKPNKQRRDDSEGFDSRHHYTPYWGPQQQTWVPQQPQNQFMVPPNGQFSAQTQPSYPSQIAQGYAQQPPAYPTSPGMIPGTSYPAFGVPQYPQPPQQRYGPNDSVIGMYGSPVQPAPPQPGWQAGFHMPPQQPRQPGASAVLHGPGGIPYAFGQLPANANPHDPKSQHPIPGSYNRNHNFNPKTQSFVPGGGPMVGVPPPQPPFTAPGSHHGSPQIGPPHLTYPVLQQAVPPPYGGGYGMARQGSSNSMPAYHPPPPQHVSPPHSQHGQLIPNPPLGPAQQLPRNPQVNVPPRPPNAILGPNQHFSHLPTYGNPATLPQKPASGI